jgi:hypothetical protein
LCIRIPVSFIAGNGESTEGVPRIPFFEALGANAEHARRDGVGHGAVELNVMDACGERVEGWG